MSVVFFAGPLAFASNAWAQTTAGAEAAPASAPPVPPLAATPATEEVSSPVRDEAYAGHVRATVREESQNPFRQSVLILDQSATTQTFDLGPTPQSYVPLYEIWLSLRPRYYFDEHWSVRGRFDYTKELTNNQATTQYR